MITAVWVLVITTCGIPGFESTCHDELLTGYTYPTQEDCRLEREALKAFDAICVDASVSRKGGK